MGQPRRTDPPRRGSHLDRRTVRGPSHPHARRRRGHFRRIVADLSRTRSALRACRPGAGRSRGGPRATRRAVDTAFARRGRRDAGRREDRGGLRADRSGGPGCPSRVRARGLRTRGRAHHRRTRRSADRTTGSRARHRGRHERSGRHPGCRAAATTPGRHRLPDLHLRHHREAEGRGDPTPQREPSAGHPRRGHGPGRACLVAVPLAGLRLLRLGDLGSPAVRWPRGRRARHGGALAGGPARAARGRTGHRAQPDPVRVLRAAGRRCAGARRRSRTRA